MILAGVLAYPLLGAPSEVVGFVGMGGGSHLNARVMIKETDGKKVHALCPGGLAKNIARYQRMKVSVKIEAGKNCFKPISYELLQTANGRKPVIGVLEKQGNQYFVSHDGKKYLLDKVPRKLKQFEKKKMVLDLAKSLKENNPGNIYNVMFYAPAP